MKLAIIGTRGIPNNYGGFEQLAEYMSLKLVQKGHEVYVYSSSKHSYQEKEWKGVNIIHQPDPEHRLGSAGQFIYDLNCILNSRKHNFDVILNLGYTSSSLWMRLFPKNSRVVTNMDGLEWKRTKYSKKVQRFLMLAEKWAVKRSDSLVADSLAIKKYLFHKYNVDSTFIAYGAELFINPDKSVLNTFKVEPFEYNMLIARMEPENNIEMILEGVQRSKSTTPFFVIGNHKNEFGTYLHKKYASDPRIIFTGPIYDTGTINNLRYYSKIYFHGHSVGGTNPSLLEAMGCSALIAAHGNEFNKSVLNEDAYYFKDNQEVSTLLETIERASEKNRLFISNNYSKIENDYTWEKITNQYEQVLSKK